ncbi:hypothetical protein Tcan_09831 [Toxocara canis]|uniref:G-protein coupled receptors family 1 profile domain-containing protein n=1 Tax=Toxocara canis TaxID=6265 RepID=A0A0B2VB96_TOXCA|nr:hypothetical protein Tcan_09831 [Toxocara canis]
MESVNVIRFARMPLSLLSTIGNLIVLIIVLRYPILRRNSSNMLIAQLCLADFAYSVGLLIRITNTEINFANNNTVFRRADCLFVGICAVLGIHLIQTTIPMVAIDRLSCLLFPVGYRRLNNRVEYSILRFVPSAVYTLISTSAEFIGFPPHGTTTVCSSGSSWNKHYRFYFAIFSTSSASLTCAVFLATLFVYWHRMAHEKKRVTDSVILTTTAILTAYVIFWCTPTLIYLYCYIFDVRVQNLGPLVFVVSLGNSVFTLLNPVLFLWKHSEFRTYFFRFFGCTKFAQRNQIVARTKQILPMNSSL